MWARTLKHSEDVSLRSQDSFVRVVGKTSGRDAQEEWQRRAGEQATRQQLADGIR